VANPRNARRHPQKQIDIGLLLEGI
jgi:hypothetical protein